MTLRDSEAAHNCEASLPDISGPNTLAYLEARIRWLRAYPNDEDASLSSREVAERLSQHLHEPWPPAIKSFVCDLMAGKFSEPIKHG